MTDPEAIGDAVTGGLMARALEPDTGEAADGHTHERTCLNCGCALEGAYCHCCGQKAHVHRTLAAFGHDLAHSVLHFEGKIWRTLPLLAWRPGELTRRYITGERSKFVSPMALFLFTVFLMFAAYSALGMGVHTDTVGATTEEMRSAVEHERKDLRELEQARAKLLESGEREKLPEIDQEIADTRAGIKALEQFLAIRQGDTNQLVGLKTGWTRIDEGLKKLNANPALALYKLQSNAYKYSWALIPISVPFVWLLFLHRRRYRRYNAYDHTVFVTYSIAFVSLWLILLAILKQIPGTGSLRAAMLLIPPIHMYRQLRGAYDLSRFSAVWRTAALLLFAFVAIALFLLLVLALGIA
jgi:hypothetical protein